VARGGSTAEKKRRADKSFLKEGEGGLGEEGGDSNSQKQPVRRSGRSYGVPVVPVDVGTEADSASTSTSTSTHSSFSPPIGAAKKTIVLPGGFEDQLTVASYVAETNLPTDVGHFRIRAYRIGGAPGSAEAQQTLKPHPLGAGAGLGSEPCVIYCTDKPPFGARGGERGGRTALPVRIHDQCFTSEVFRSQRCDCRDQLKMSLEYIREHGGAVIYLQQEGRGIGLANKVAAYALQDVGMDTVDANVHLGFPEDARQYGVIPSILADMGIDSIRLMTNNPRKINRLHALGVDVVGTIPMVVPKANPYNRNYLETKQERMNHKNFGDMLSSSPSKSDSADRTYVNSMLANNANSDTDSEVMDSGAQIAETMAETIAETIAEPTAPQYITEGEEMAAAAVAAALTFTDDGNADRTGVTASDDGYCFGRESVERAIAAVARGELIVVVDDEGRENEGDFIMAAEKATPEKMAEFVRYSSGVICIGMEGERMDELELPAMVVNSQDPKQTAFSVSVDGVSEHGITTGISATDRATTSVLLASPKTTKLDFARPGHIFPLRARENGVLTRDGHTEAAVDFARLAGCSPVGLLCEIVSEEEPVEMARLPELKRFCKRRGYVLTSIVDLQQYRRDTESLFPDKE